jgi:hypothetical protein
MAGRYVERSGMKLRAKHHATHAAATAARVATPPPAAPPSARHVTQVPQPAAGAAVDGKAAPTAACGDDDLMSQRQ